MTLLLTLLGTVGLMLVFIVGLIFGVIIGLEVLRQMFRWK